MLAVWIVLGVLGVLALYAVLTFNRLVRNRNRVENAWAGIDVQLRRRYDLIPNLVETVRGYARHERRLFEEVTRARAQGIEAGDLDGQAAAENQITRGLRRLFAVAESYPELKANENFLALQEELTATESKIAFARQFFNDRVLRYNTMVQQFPSMLVAGATGHRTRDFFEIEEDSRAPARIEFP